MSKAMHEARPPDLVMLVTMGETGSQSRLTYSLHSATGKAGFIHREFLGPLLRGGAKEFQEYLLAKIERLARLADVNDAPLEPEEVEWKLANLGRDLWRELIPAEFSHAYRQIREEVESWVIVSDETWIPWELIKPYDNTRPGELIDDDFLAHRFKLTRWLTGELAFRQRLQVESFAVLETAADLPLSGRERTLVSEIVRSGASVKEVSPVLKSSRDTLAFLAGEGADLLHFIGHGGRDALRPNEAGLPFPDGSALRPQDLGGPLASRLGEIHPFVFLNACWAGQQGASFTRLGGWATRWVEVCGGGAFVAPLWPVRDDTAYSFARCLYSALARGETLGAAALEARRQAYSEQPGDASALAYTVYGHPNAVVSFGPAKRAEEGESASVAASPALTPILFPPPLHPRPFRPSPYRAPSISWLSPAVRRSLVMGTVLLLLLASSSRSCRWLPALADRGVAGTLISDPLAQEPRTAPHGPGPSPVELLWARRQGSSASHPVPNGAGSPRRAALPLAGNTLELAAAAGVPTTALVEALGAAARPLPAAGIQGWALRLEIERPSVTDQTESGLAWKQCRLTAQGHARRPPESLDLGRVFADNLQSDAGLACEGAAGDLAKSIIDRLVAATRKEKR